MFKLHVITAANSTGSRPGTDVIEFDTKEDADIACDNLLATNDTFVSNTHLLGGGSILVQNFFIKVTKLY